MTALSILIPVGGATTTDPWRSRALTWLLARYRALLPDAELVLGTSDADPFSRSAARNDAFVRSSGDVLLIADADTLFNVDQITAGLGLIDAGAPWVICYEVERYYALTQQATLSTLASDPSSYIPEPTDSGDWELKLTSWAGLLLVPLASWACVGGYDIRFQHWSYEDNSFAAALDMMAGPHERVDAACLHLWHQRGLEFDGPGVPENRALWERYQNARTVKEMSEVIELDTRAEA